MTAQLALKAEKQRDSGEGAGGTHRPHVVLWDERMTVAAHTKSCTAAAKEKKHRQNVDAVAATLILQGYLDFKRRQ